MPKLFIYGDSYSNSTKFETWPKLVADGLNYELVNSAVPGSSTEYSFLKWSNDVKEHTFAPNDKIIFVISSPGRLHFEYQLFADPSSGSRFTFQNLDTKDSKNFWHTANKDKIRWYLQHRSLELNQLTHEAYLNTFKVFAFENPTIDFLALNNSHYENILNLNIEPSNFFHPKISLQEVSSNEQVQKNMEFLEWAKYTRFDARNNHLTIPNHKILTNLILQTLNERSSNFWSVDDFKKNNIDQIRSLKDYDFYVSNALIFRNTEISKNLGN